MKRNLHLKTLPVLLLLLIFNSASAQWTSIAPVYGGMIANDGAVSFSIGGKGYLVAGSSTDDFYSYDTLSNSWSLLGPVPAAMGHAFAMSFVIDDKAYVVGGDTGGYPMSTVWQFDPSNGNTWTQKNNFPGGVRDAAAGFAIGSYGYIAAGFDGNNFYSDIWRYNPQTDTWFQMLASLPIGGIIFPSSFVVNSKAYILTGGTAPQGVNETRRMWCFDPSNDSLSEKAAFGGVGRQAAIAFSINGYGFAGGGMAGYVTNFWDMWKYDPASDSWSVSDTIPMLGSAWASAFTIGNTAYAGIGAKFVGAGLTGTDAFYKYTMQSPTAVNNIDGDSQVSVYPNPAAGQIFLTGMKSEKYLLTIYDLTGKQLINKTILGNDYLSINELNSGVYTITIDDGSIVSRKKLIVQ